MIEVVCRCVMWKKGKKRFGGKFIEDALLQGIKEVTEALVNNSLE